VVIQIRRMIRKPSPRSRTKVGHAGTLDPFAGGVLVVCLGAATRLAEYVHRYDKRYSAEVTLGATSTTDDPEGEIAASSPADRPDVRRVEQTISSFVGDVDQVPATHSAVHVEGRRAYKIARTGKVPVLEPRRVHIEAISLVSYNWPKLAIDVRCGSGTYIRALARDIGARLGVGGYCSGLVRTAVGPFHLADALAPETISLPEDVADPLSALTGMPQVVLPDQAVALIADGRHVPAEQAKGELPRVGEGDLAVLDERGSLLAVAAIDAAGMIRPLKVFPQTD
jgi:tRNA pseudouridine55 synthase